MEKKPERMFSLNYFFFPKKNHWMKRIFLVFAFIIFDYFSTLILCRIPSQEANLYARFFMESFGIQLGLTIFVFIVNLPIYVTLSLDSHIIRLPFKVAVITECLVDVIFAWFVAGLHFNGGTSWFWRSPELMRQSIGSLMYLVMVFLLVKPYNPHYDD